MAPQGKDAKGKEGAKDSKAEGKEKDSKVEEKEAQPANKEKGPKGRQPSKAEQQRQRLLAYKVPPYGESGAWEQVRMQYVCMKYV